ncbi:MAG: M23 family metallopeptidase [Microbacterium sp.]|nr:M23 family metallopeptidase [Microbacterium sp.]
MPSSSLVASLNPGTAAQSPAAEPAVDGAAKESTAKENTADWKWPVVGPRAVTARFRAPAHEYGAGHRGIDLVAADGTSVLSPHSGVVAFRGVVVDRPLLTIDHGGGYVSTFEPLESSLMPGTVVEEGDPIGTVMTGGHTPLGSLHLGVRWNGDYVDPQLLFGGAERAVLLPCCAPLR